MVFYRLERTGSRPASAVIPMLNCLITLLSLSKWNEGVVYICCLPRDNSLVLAFTLIKITSGMAKLIIVFSM